ncbi:hypothetical protein [Arthrobacter sp. PAMC 25486]|uniref:hypothetical protein n=1 Tax=Arthrobacter sp. PAMC 25486 TaxID=1494608 RepID=UPI0006912573|nr:hypothetical protein [Arthrobacter sp. PAMC 25486]
MSKPIFTTHYQRWQKRPYYVPDRLPVLPAELALRKTTVPLRLNGHLADRGRVFDLADLHERGEVYADVIVEGEAADILAYIDGASLVEIWDTHLILPWDVAAVWKPLIDDWRENN